MWHVELGPPKQAAWHKVLKPDDAHQHQVADHSAPSSVVAGCPRVHLKDDRCGLPQGRSHPPTLERRRYRHHVPRVAMVRVSVLQCKIAVKCDVLDSEASCVLPRGVDC